MPNAGVRATRTPTPAKPELVTPTAAQLRQLADAAVGTPWEIPVLLAATTGCRLGESLGLRWARVDLEAGRVQIVEALQRVNKELVFSEPKTEQAKRTIPVPAWALTRLRAHKADQAKRRLALGAAWVDLDLVCERGDGAPLLPDSVSHAFAKIAKRAGIGCRFHDMRHGIGSALGKAGTPAYVTARVLGHASPYFTAATYQHADDEQVDRALAGLEAAFGPAT